MRCTLERRPPTMYRIRQHSFLRMGAAQSSSASVGDPVGGSAEGSPTDVDREAPPLPRETRHELDGQSGGVYDTGPESPLETGVHEINGWSRASFNSLIEMMQYFCFARKPSSHFRGAVTFVFPPPKSALSGKEMIFTLVFEPEMSENSTPVITLIEGNAPEWVPVECHVRVPAEIFELIFTSELKAKEITKMVIRGELRARGWTALAKFGYGYEYTRSCWKRFYDHRSRLRGVGLWPEYTPLTSNEKSRVIFSSAVFSPGTSKSGESKPCPAMSATIPVRQVEFSRLDLPPRRMQRPWWNFHEEVCAIKPVIRFQISDCPQLPEEGSPCKSMTYYASCSLVSCDYDIADWTSMGLASLADARSFVI